MQPGSSGSPATESKSGDEMVTHIARYAHEGEVRYGIL